MRMAVSSSEQQTAFSLLERQSLLQGTDDNIKALFANACQAQEYERDKILFLQDDPAEWFYIIASGWIKLFRETMDGHETVLDTLTTGQSFGEIAVLEDDTHTYGACIVEKAVLYRLPISLLKKTVEENHKVALSMLQTMAQHRKRQTHEIESLTLQNASQRIGCFLLRLCDPFTEGETTLQLPYDKSLIAARLGMKSETFSRALNKLKEHTDISVQGAKVIIPSLDAISGYTCSACSNEFPCEDLH